MFTTTPLKKWLRVRANYPHVKKKKKKEKEKEKKKKKRKDKKRKRKKIINLDVHYHAT